MAYFLDMSKLEAWSKNHPTHLAIFDSFLSLAQRLGNEITLRLGTKSRCFRPMALGWNTSTATGEQVCCRSWA